MDPQPEDYLIVFALPMYLALGSVAFAIGSIDEAVNKHCSSFLFFDNRRRRNGHRCGLAAVIFIWSTTWPLWVWRFVWWKINPYRYVTFVGGDEGTMEDIIVTQDAEAAAEAQAQAASALPQQGADVQAVLPDAPNLKHHPFGCPWWAQV